MKIVFNALTLILISNINLYGEGLHTRTYNQGILPSTPSMTTHLSSQSAWTKKISRGKKISTCKHQNRIYNRYHKSGKQWYVQTGGKCQFCAKVTWATKWHPINAFGQLGRTFQQKHHNSNGQNQPSAIPSGEPEHPYQKSLRGAYLPSR